MPIELQRQVTRPEQVPDTSKPPEADGTIPMKTQMNKVNEWMVVNTKKPLWLRPTRECTPSDYSEFYKQTFNAFDEPAAHAHFSVEGNVDFKAILYLPSEVPYELSRDMFSSAARSLRLYVKRVFINDKFEDLIPRWLLFVRGVVDSDDLPLNVGREILQQSRSLRIIKQRLVKRTIDMMTDLANTNATAYNTFWKNFGKYVKVGIIEDEKVRDDLIPLCRFFSSATGSGAGMGAAANQSQTSLPEYVSRMPAEQKHIYYIVGETRSAAAMSPALEQLKQKGFEVLYVSEPIDEMTLQNIETYQGKTVMDAGKEASASDLSEEEKASKEQTNQDFEEVRAWIKSVLGDKITRVEMSTRLVDSPATLVQSEYGVSPNMQKYLRAQAVVEAEDKGEFANIFNQAVLEVNPTHPITLKLKQIAEDEQRKGLPESRELVEIVFSTAALAAGYLIDDGPGFAVKVSKLMAKAMQA